MGNEWIPPGDVEAAIGLLRARFVMRDDAYLSEKRQKVDQPLDDDVLRAHLFGFDRIGSYPTAVTRVLCFDSDGKTPKRQPKGRDAALREARAIAAVLDADLGFPPALLEESRSGSGFHVWTFFDDGDLPTVEEIKEFGRRVLRAAGLRDDEKESEGAVGIYPHPPGPKGYGKTPYLPWAGLLNGKATGTFVELATGTPLVDQVGVLAGVVVVRRAQLGQASKDLEGCEPPPAVVASEPPEMSKPESPLVAASALADPRAMGMSRHDALRGEVMRLRSFLAIDETRTLAFALAEKYGLLKEGRGGEVENLVVGAYQKPAIRVCTQYEREREGGPVPRAVDLYDVSIVPKSPEFTVKDFVRRVGIHLIWAVPGGLKTWTLLTWFHELMVHPGRASLCDHPGLWINRRYTRLLWIATEEEAEVLRYKAEMVRRGLSWGEHAGEIRYLFAADRGRRITLNDLPAIYEAEGPLNAVVLDSLTGLRPKTVNGEKVRWDIDNDAANEACLELRSIAKQYDTAIFIVHHTGRDTKKGYRGATDWWASADVMIGFQPDGDRSKVVVEKNRDAKKIPAFLLEPSWADGVFSLRYMAADTGGGRVLTPTAYKVMDFFGQLVARGRRNASQKEVCGAVPASRSAVLSALQLCTDVGRLHLTGLKDGNSPIYGFGPAESDSRSDSDDDE